MKFLRSMRSLTTISVACKQKKKRSLPASRLVCSVSCTQGSARFLVLSHSAKCTYKNSLLDLLLVQARRNRLPSPVLSLDARSKLACEPLSPLPLDWKGSTQARDPRPNAPLSRLEVSKNTRMQRMKHASNFPSLDFLYKQNEYSQLNFLYNSIPVTAA
ncbi:hypothetical protein MA16_Dca009306 [Dendrobium catenatum]|uniref:Uncharacterized protein n=1 Tax=Dendrobium catenatum TaxID=906689 RepID=A0A2I0WZ04_9ASPA|nr:hypothetical protein MA16_Dca009306 [Dendrobium catenatum]